MIGKKNFDLFWASYADLMTSLFFVMLMLFVLTIYKLNKTIKLQKEKLAIIETVEENLKPLRSDSTLFVYENEYKRFKLGFDVKFVTAKTSINSYDLENYTETIQNINKAGFKLRTIIDNLNQKRKSDPRLDKVSYILVIAGSASQFKGNDKQYNYQISYNRALSLWNYWKMIGIDFEDKKYEGLIDLQIAGNGWGGVGRDEKIEENNQRFLIQIFPKIGNI
jgi:hypothetical protein